MIFCEHWYWSPSSIDKGIVLMQQIEINNKNTFNVETHIIDLIIAQFKALTTQIQSFEWIEDIVENTIMPWI